ncbi:hypothetical protein T459_21292 [Capsicum annuum]|uniref:Ubiquinol oxidase n=1 Tax=Capsicum annuum TaxID=4072 RepID=A0A2G2YWM1_CAPAN|nr:hypothetical protein T459_21292 [Capsicum annuum]
MIGSVAGIGVITDASGILHGNSIKDSEKMMVTYVRYLSIINSHNASNMTLSDKEQNDQNDRGNNNNSNDDDDDDDGDDVSYWGYTMEVEFFYGTILQRRYDYHAMMLEIVAAVPGMVGEMLLHCKSLRRFENSDGWIKALLEEAENERMNLMTFMEVSKPKWVVGLWHFGWSSILLQVTEKVMANKDTELVVTNQIGSLGNENVGANEEIQKLRQQMIEMHRAWANGFPPPPFPADNLEYLSSLPPVSHA